MALAYTKEQTEELVATYTSKPSKETILAMCTKFGKTERSIIGKLSKEGVYKREVYKSKTGELPIAKADLCADIARYLEVEVEDIAGLEKAPKAALKRILTELEALLGKPE